MGRLGVGGKLPGQRFGELIVAAGLIVGHER